jgi:hypothetical protein
MDDLDDTHYLQYSHWSSLILDLESPRSNLPPDFSLPNLCQLIYIHSQFHSVSRVLILDPESHSANRRPHFSASPTTGPLSFQFNLLVIHRLSLSITTKLHIIVHGYGYHDAISQPHSYISSVDRQITPCNSTYNFH